MINFGNFYFAYFCFRNFCYFVFCQVRVRDGELRAHMEATGEHLIDN